MTVFEHSSAAEFFGDDPADTRTLEEWFDENVHQNIGMYVVTQGDTVRQHTVLLFAQRTVTDDVTVVLDHDARRMTARHYTPRLAQSV